MRKLFSAIIALLIATCSFAQTGSKGTLTYNYIKVDNCNVFYREAGSPSHPTILLLHGFPSASHMFRDLITELADDYHLVAPDFPGFGKTYSPERNEFDYTFDNIAKVVDKFTEQLGLNKYAMYVFDYGAPIGFRLAMWHPERITAIVSQNGNIYDEGLGKEWESRKKYWANPTPELRKQFASAYKLETIRSQYSNGAPMNSVSPDNYTLDYTYINQPGRDEIQNDLILDYQNNIKLYPQFQQYLRDNLPPVLAVWGKNDKIFNHAGALAFKRDQPKAAVHFVDGGHYALESHHKRIALLIRDFLKRELK